MAGIVKMMAAAVVAAGCFVSTAASAELTSVANDGFKDLSPSGSTVITFDSGLPDGFSLNGKTTLDSTVIKSGDNYPAWLRPGADATKFLVTSANTSNTLSSKSGFSGVAFQWGTIDTYNSLDILDLAGNIIRTVTGSNVLGTDGIVNRYVSFTLDPSTNQQIGGLRFTSTKDAFEVDNVAFFGGAPTSVPEPATLTLFGAGIGGLVAASRRRRKKTA